MIFAAYLMLCVSTARGAEYPDDSAGIDTTWS